MKRIILYTIILMALTACTTFKVQKLETTGTDIPQVNMPNPASVYCEQNGNKLEIQTASDDSQSGVCIFPDGSTCDEWAYFRGECGLAQQKSPTPTIAIEATNEAEVLFCWMGDKPLQNGNKYLLQHNNRSVRAVIKNLEYKIDVNSLEHIEDVQQVKLNEIVKASIKTAAPIVFDSYKKNRSNGAAILIDETSNATVAAVLFQ